MPILLYKRTHPTVRTVRAPTICATVRCAVVSGCENAPVDLTIENFFLIDRVVCITLVKAKLRRSREVVLSTVPSMPDALCSLAASQAKLLTTLLGKNDQSNSIKSDYVLVMRSRSA